MKFFKKQFTKVFFSNVLLGYTIICYSLPTDQLTLNSSTAKFFTVGSYNDKYPHSQPMILIGNDHGRAWSFVKNISHMPTDLKEASLSAIYCLDNNCITVGTYKKNDTSISLPLILLSNDKGQSWTFTNNISGLPSNYDINLYTVACSSNTCMAGGIADKYDGSHRNFFPLLLQSKDNGKSWSRINGGVFINLKNKEGGINKITRSGNNWIAAGYYYSCEFPHPLSYQRPFLLFSRDDGASWSFFKKNSGLPSSIIGGGLNTINCSNNICLAGGWGGSNEKNIPLLLKSNNNGQSWSLVKNISDFPPSASENNPHLNAFSCSGNTCVTVGEWWISESPTGTPLLMLSHDNGESWKTIDTVSGLPANLKYPVLNTVFCADNTCLAGGFFARNSNLTGLPLLLISKDDGYSWALVKTISGLPANFKDASITSITCSGNDCTAIGGWWWQSSDTTLPLLLLSHDRGQSWSYMQNIIDLPLRMESGWLGSSLVLQ